MAETVFSNNLITFTSDITGEEKEYKINNAIWILLESKYKVSQAEFGKLSAESENLWAARFVWAVLKANGIEVKEKDVIDNTDAVDCIAFVMAHNEAMNKKGAEVFSAFGESEEDEEGKS
ncbi:hypothetical protein [Hutsoniella sourekii]|uniref:hypothetical protein n=1 Tax=Hutsoniella sourekii TaxID=87650 RepID=UPI0004889E3D|nr:hypothetical protein [Hutsoniella sourekii]